VDTVELSLVPAMASFEESKQRKADIVVASAEKVPDPWKGYVVKAAPVLGAVGAGVELAMPYVSKAYDKGLELWELLQPYHPEDMACVFFGLFMCFFGGEFPALITAIEAYRQVGFEPTWRALKILKADFDTVKDASLEDDKKDEDGDGVADVRQISASDLVERKALLFRRVRQRARAADEVRVLAERGLDAREARRLRAVRREHDGHGRRLRPARPRRGRGDAFADDVGRRRLRVDDLVRALGVADAHERDGGTPDPLALDGDAKGRRRREDLRLAPERARALAEPREAFPEVVGRRPARVAAAHGDDDDVGHGAAELRRELAQRGLGRARRVRLRRLGDADAHGRGAVRDGARRRRVGQGRPLRDALLRERAAHGLQEAQLALRPVVLVVVDGLLREDVRVAAAPFFYGVPAVAVAVVCEGRGEFRSDARRGNAGARRWARWAAPPPRPTDFPARTRRSRRCRGRAP